eukprot:365596-Chlamydomonas_euryale.AAC.8
MAPHATTRPNVFMLSSAASSVCPPTLSVRKRREGARISAQRNVRGSASCDTTGPEELRHHRSRGAATPQVQRSCGTTGPWCDTTGPWCDTTGPWCDTRSHAAHMVSRPRTI